MVFSYYKYQQIKIKIAYREFKWAKFTFICDNVIRLHLLHATLAKMIHGIIAT